jgi:hypothetical protein
MLMRIKKSGGNLILVIPPQMAKELMLEEDSPVKCEISEGNLLVKPLVYEEPEWGSSEEPQLESLEEAFAIPGEVPADLQKQLSKCFPHDQRFRNPLGRYLSSGLDNKLIPRPDVETHADALEENREMISGEIQGKLPWTVVYAHLEFCKEALGESFREINSKIAEAAINDAEQLKRKMSGRIYINFEELFRDPEIKKMIDAALQEVASKLHQKATEPGGREYLRRLPSKCREHIRDKTLKYWAMDFERRLTTSEVALWVESIVHHAKSRAVSR